MILSTVKAGAGRGGCEFPPFSATHRRRLFTMERQMEFSIGQGIAFFGAAYFCVHIGVQLIGIAAKSHLQRLQLESEERQAQETAKVELKGSMGVSHSQA